MISGGWRSTPSAGLALRDKAPRADQTLISARLACLFQITNRHEKTTGLSFFYYLPQILFSIIRSPGKPWWNNRPRLTMCMKGKTDLRAREFDSSVQSSCVPNFSPNVSSVPLPVHSWQGHNRVSAGGVCLRRQGLQSSGTSRRVFFNTFTQST